MTTPVDSPKLGDTLIGFIRTYVPIVVGSLAAWLITLGIELDSTAQAALVVGLTGLLSAAWYGLARLLSAKWAWAGWLLGYPSTPAYEPKHSAK